MWRQIFQAGAILAALALPLPSSIRADEPAALPDHVQDIAKEILAKAKKTWRKDAYVTTIRLAVTTSSDGSQTQNTLYVTLYSPSKQLAEIVPHGQQYGDYPMPIAAGTTIDLGPVPDFTIDLPQAVAIARQHGMTGKLNGAYIEVHHPTGKAPILAWVVQTDDPVNNMLQAKVPAIDPFTGEVIPFNKAFDPPPGSDKELAAAARRFWMALHGRFHGGGGMPFEFGSAHIGADGQPDGENYYSSDDHDREVLLENTYWNEGPEAYNAALNGESTWTETCDNAGC
jgi:hypothetical protein